MTVEDLTLLRTRENYASDVEEADRSSTGVKELCAFHRVNKFHITENISVDFMHDFLEGVCKYVMGAIIERLIFTDKRFTLEFLNTRIKIFLYDYIENANKPPIITLNKVKNKLK